MAKIAVYTWFKQKKKKKNCPHYPFSFHKHSIDNASELK